MIFSSIVPICFAIWFYGAAKPIGKSPLVWAVIGFCTYKVSGLIWGAFVLPSLMDMSGPGIGKMALVIPYTYVLVGSFSALLVWSTLLDRKG